MTKNNNNFKRGDIIMANPGQYAYLHHDEGDPLPCYDEGPDTHTPGEFSSLFYIPAMGIHCADWGTFTDWRYPDARPLTEAEKLAIPEEFKVKVAEKDKEYEDIVKNGGY